MTAGDGASLPEHQAREPGWRREAALPGLSLWVEGTAPPITVLPHQLGVILGRLHPRRPGDDRLFGRLDAGSSARDACRLLTEHAWGSYVALFPARSGAPWAYRDPSGGVSAVAWARDGVFAVSSGLEGIAPELRPPKLGLRWDRIAGWLADPLAVEWLIGLEGIEALLPGVLARLDAPDRGEALWRPDTFARRPTPSAEREALRAVVDDCTRRLAAPYRTVVAEISGGLDSAIVATSLCAAAPRARVAAAINYYADRREGDERRFARLVAEAAGLELTEVAKDGAPITEADLREVAGGTRPMIGGVDAPRDRDTAARAQALLAEAIFSGQGGDAVFFQAPSPRVFADALAGGAAGTGWLSLALEVALWTRRSVWAVAWDAWREHRDKAPPPARAALPGDWQDAPFPHHPWLVGVDDLPAGKRLHLRGVANAVLYRTPVRRSEVADLVYPLLAQPVVETCLALPTYVLTRGGRDRALARAAFADRLPLSVWARRGKGDLGAFYGRVVAASLDTLRPLLLDGRLCASGLLDRRVLEVALTPERLMWEGRVSAILQAAAIEAWIQHWQTRVPDSPRAVRPGF